MGEKPYIDYALCDVCSTCIDVCPVQVFAKEGGKVVVKNPNACIGCRACEVSCPKQAITVK
ncbi:MAG: 4Fe-4S binding protein [archaeon]